MTLKRIKNTRFLQLFQTVRRLSADCPKTVRKLSADCPRSFLIKCCSTVRRLSEDCPKTVRRLSATKRKKRTTPFGGMARPYYSLLTPIFHSPSQLSFISYLLLPLASLKFSQEHC